MNLLLPCLTLSLLASTAMAQERAAGQAYAAQVNWSALANKIDAVSTQNKALAASMASLQASLKTLQATVNALSSKVVVLDTKVSAMATCSARKQFWTGKSCAAVPGGAAPKLITTVFTLNNRYPGPSAASCTARGYDAITSYEPIMTTRHTGGRTGGDETVLTGYRVTCIRAVPR